jgi:hypothetical protein
MLLLLGSGFEVIRRLGTTLTAPPDIAGPWRLTPPSSADPCPILEWGASREGELKVEQSGRYLHLTFPDVDHTRLSAYFADKVFQGSGVSTPTCARGAPVYLSGRLTESRLELVLTRSQQPPGAAAATLSLSAVRTPAVADRPSTAAQSPALGRNKE